MSRRHPCRGIGLIERNQHAQIVVVLEGIEVAVKRSKDLRTPARDWGGHGKCRSERHGGCVSMPEMVWLRQLASGLRPSDSGTSNQPTRRLGIKSPLFRPKTGFLGAISAPHSASQNPPFRRYLVPMVGGSAGACGEDA